MKLVRCERCGAKWINDLHYWATGKPGSELDLAGLVCNRVNDDRCPNPMKGQTGGDTWEARAARMVSLAPPDSPEGA
jgi:hypothetical protein